MGGDIISSQMGEICTLPTWTTAEKQNNPNNCLRAALSINTKTSYNSLGLALQTVVRY